MTELERKIKIMFLKDLKEVFDKYDVAVEASEVVGNYKNKYLEGVSFTLRQTPEGKRSLQDILFKVLNGYVNSEHIEKKIKEIEKWNTIKYE